MKPRMNFYQAAPEPIKALSALETSLQGSGLGQSLIELVKTRASQINGCASASICIRGRATLRWHPAFFSRLPSDVASWRSYSTAAEVATTNHPY
jgi:alkylhydroperoxidase family enzyme